VFIGQVDEDATAMIPVERLDHHRISQPLRRGDGLVRGPHHLGTRNRDADLVHEPVCQLLVARDVDVDVAGLEVTVAQIRCWYLPCPSWTSDRRGSSRSTGIPRRTASWTIAPVDGP